jgi:DNA repair exonuclease SbcCD nuclease subunit
MKFIFMSDIHGRYKRSASRTDDVGKAFEKKIKFVFKYAKKNQCVILQAGDLNDESRNWLVLSFLMKVIRKYLVMLFCVFGQHDLYMRRDPEDTPTNLSILIESGQVRRLGKKPVHFQNCDVYGANWGDPIPKVEDSDYKNILVLHAPISRKKEYPGHENISPRRFMRKNKDFKIVLVGDIHKKIFYKNGDRYLLNTGPLLRLEATKYNMKHKPCFYVWDDKTNNIETVIIPHKKSRVVLTRDNIEQKLISVDELSEFAKSLKNIKINRQSRSDGMINFARKNVSELRVRKLIKEIVNGRINKRNGRKSTSIDNDI